MKLKARYPYIDLHVAGEPFRLITELNMDIPGATMEDKRQYALRHLFDTVGLLLKEPRGHDDMYGGILLPPVCPGSDVGVLFMYPGEFTTLCGHGCLCLARAAVELGIKKWHEGENVLTIDAPAATVKVHILIEKGEVCKVTLENEKSFACRYEQEVSVEHYGKVKVDIGYGGAFMVFAKAADFGLSIRQENTAKLLAAAMACKSAVEGQLDAVHPTEPHKNLREDGCCMILTEQRSAASGNVDMQCFTAYGNCEIDRSPTGTGTSALAAILYDKGVLTRDGRLVNKGISGLPFEAVVRPVDGGVIPYISSTAYVVSRGELLLEKNDPLTSGFSLKNVEGRVK